MSLKRARLWKRLVTAVQIVALLLALAVPAAANTAPSQVSLERLQVLTDYRIVRGDSTGNLNLDQPITRAEMATIMVRALGLDQEAANMVDMTLFPDARGHWGAGYINTARIKGIVKGDDQGNFRPNSQVTYAEAFTMILRLIGREPSASDWPTSALLMAMELRLLPEGFPGFSAMNRPAIRGDVFQSLAVGLSVQTPEGKTYLQKYVDSTPPTITLNTVAATTPNETVTISGTAKGAATVLVNGKKVDLNLSEQFSTTVTLQHGVNTITVEAADRAGNKATATASVTRALPAAKLDVTGPAEVAINGTATFTVTAYDAANASVATTGLTAKVEGNIGTFDVATSTFKAAATGGTGKITFTLGTLSKSVDVKVLGQNADAARLFIRTVNNGMAVPKTREMTVEVEVQNSLGETLTNDYGRPVTLLPTGISGVTVTPNTTVNTVAGVATFKLKSNNEGTLSLNTASGTLATANRIAEFGTPIQVVLSAENPTLIFGGSPYMTRIKAELKDDQGNLITNNGDADIQVTLSLNGVGVLSDQYLTIRRGYSSSTASGDDGRFEIGGATGAGSIRGEVTSNHRYSVSGTSVSVTQPTVGSGAKLEVMTPSSGLTPGDTATFIIRATDTAGNTVTAGSYAFQIKVDTSNNDTKTNGIPDGVTVTLGDTAHNPVADAYAEGATGDTTDVIGRTVSGQAIVKVRYTKGGSVTITPVMVGATNQGYSDTGITDNAASSTFMTPKPASAVWSNAAAGFKVTVDSELGADQPTGATANSASRFFTVRVRVVDSDNNWVPNASNSIKLTRTTNNSATTLPVPDTRQAAGGVAEFRIYASANAPATDTYTVSSNGLASATVDLTTRSAVAAQPEIRAIRGVKNGIPNQTWTVAADDTHMEIDLAPAPASGWVAVKVYTESGTTPIYTSGAVNMNDLPPQIRVPKDKVPTGTNRFQVVLVNGYGDSLRSLSSDVVTHARTLSGISINYARFDGVTNTLTVSTNGGISSTSGWIDTSKLTIVKGSNRLSLLGTQGVIAVNSSYIFTVNLAGVADTLKTTTYSGADVNLEADAGWYMQNNGDAAQVDQTSNLISPLAVATAVTYDTVRKTITIEGAGLNVATLDLSKITIIDSSTNETFLFNSTNVIQSPSRTDNRITVSLTTTGNDLLKNTTKFNGGDVLKLADGWIRYDNTSQVSGTPVGQELPVYSQVSVTGVRYNKTSNTLTITGSGFGGGTSTVNAANLKIVDSNFANQPVNLGAPVSATVDNDGVITIVLTSGVGSQSAALETTSVFDGENIYLVGEENWLVDGNGRSARAIPNGTVRLPNPTQWQQ